MLRGKTGSEAAAACLLSSDWLRSCCRIMICPLYVKLVGSTANLLPPLVISHILEGKGNRMESAPAVTATMTEKTQKIAPPTETHIELNYVYVMPNRNKSYLKALFT